MTKLYYNDNATRRNLTRYNSLSPNSFWMQCSTIAFRGSFLFSINSCICRYNFSSSSLKMMLSCMHVCVFVRQQQQLYVRVKEKKNASGLKIFVYRFVFGIWERLELNYISLKISFHADALQNKTSTKFSGSDIKHARKSLYLCASVCCSPLILFASSSTSSSSCIYSAYLLERKTRMIVFMVVRFCLRFLVGKLQTIK